MKSRLIAISCIALLNACTTENWYQAFRNSAEENCRQYPGAAADDCRARQNTMTYPEYEREKAAAAVKR